MLVTFTMDGYCCRNLIWMWLFYLFAYDDFKMINNNYSISLFIIFTLIWY